jgi:hypothetical protein
MSYANFNDLVLRYPTAKNWADTPYLVNSGFIHYAEAELNGLLGNYFTVPFEAPIPPAIIDITVDLAYARKMLTQDPEHSRVVSDAVYARITRIINGEEIIMPSTAMGDTPVIISPWSNTMAFPPTHSMLDAEDSHTAISPEMNLADSEARD